MDALAALNRRPRIVFADDHPAMLKTVVGIITPRLEIVGAVGDGKSALAQVVQTAPDVVLTDISMPVMDGIRMARALKQSGSAAKIVFLTGEEDDDWIELVESTVERAWDRWCYAQQHAVRAARLHVKPHVAIAVAHAAWDNYWQLLQEAEQIKKRIIFVPGRLAEGTLAARLL